MVRELGFEMKAPPSNRMKTEEELAQEERERLKCLEVSRGRGRGRGEAGAGAGLLWEAATTGKALSTLLCSMGWRCAVFYQWNLFSL